MVYVSLVGGAVALVAGPGHCSLDAMTDEQSPEEYISYNGLGRSPMIWGIPYMAGLAIMCLSLLGGLLLGTFVASWGWLFLLLVCQ